MRHAITIPQSFCDLDDAITEFTTQNLRQPTCYEVCLMKSNIDIKHSFNKYYNIKSYMSTVIFVGDDPCHMYWIDPRN